jgi:hypothetical protein
MAAVAVPGQNPVGSVSIFLKDPSMKLCAKNGAFIKKCTIHLKYLAMPLCY